MTTPSQVVTEWAIAFNSRNAARAAALYHEEATNMQAALGEPVRGRQAIHDNFAAFFRAFPDSYAQGRARL
jgi:ketosteroid isomerase-like protein